MLSMLSKLAIIIPRGARREGGILFVLSLGLTALEALAIWLVYPLILLLLNPAGALQMPALRRFSLVFQDGEQVLLGVLLLVLAGYVLKNAYAAFVIFVQNRFAFNTQNMLSRRLFRVYLDQPYTFHMQRNSAQLINNITSEADGLVWFVFLPALTMLAEALVTAALVTLLFVIEPLAALLILAIFGSVAGMYYLLLRKRIVRWGEERQFHEWKRLRRISEGLGGIKEVKVLGRESYFLEAFMIHSTARARSFTRFQVAAALPLLILEVTGMASLITVVSVAVILGREISSVIPFLGLVAAAAFRLIPAANRILFSFQQMRYGGPVVDNLARELLMSTTDSSAISARRQELVFQQALVLDNVAYRYPDRPMDVLTGVSFVVKRGQSVAIVGPSGSGKTTLVDLILGLLEPSAGSIAVDGRDLQSMVRLWQATIGYVPQHVYLADESLRRNVAFGVADEEIDEEAVRRAIDQSQLRELVESLPQGLETVIGERGVHLSGGQIQRVGIARALYRNPEVLVLDEATSSLDIVTEAGIMEAVGKLRGEKTIFIIAHRSSTVEGCDLTLHVTSGGVGVEYPVESTSVRT